MPRLDINEYGMVANDETQAELPDTETGTTDTTEDNDGTR